MTPLARLSFWIPPDQTEAFGRAYTALVLPLLHARGWQEVGVPQRPAAPEVFSRLFEAPISIYFLMRPHLSDEDDNMFVELAFASNSPFLVTSNITHFTQKTELKFDSFEVVTPSQFVQTWRRQHGEQKE